MGNHADEWTVGSVRLSVTIIMNLALITALAVSFLLAFSIGLNLGLHGVLSLGQGRGPVRTKNNAEVDAGVKIDAPIIIPDVDTLPIGGKEKIESTDKSLPTGEVVSNTIPSKTKRGHKNIDIPPEEKAPPVDSISSSSVRSPLRVLNEIYSGKTVENAILAASSSSKKGPIAKYLEKGGKIPIVLLTCNRPEQLQSTLASLLAVRGVSKENLIISQDGAMQEVADVVNKLGLQLIQNIEGLRLRGGAGGDGAQRIAKHYRYSLSAAFDQSPHTPAIIVAEDDLLFSPDFYEYLTSTAPILENDPTTFVVSAWNDNGFKNIVKDPHALKRTEFFPGLGWLLPRELYKKELEMRWPSEHWDHWLRSVEVHGTRDIIYPEVKKLQK